MNQSMLGLLIVAGMLATTGFLLFGIFKGLRERRGQEFGSRSMPNQDEGKDLAKATTLAQNAASRKPFGYLLLSIGLLLIALIVISAFDMNEFWWLYAIFWGTIGIALIGGGYGLIRGR